MSSFYFLLLPFLLIPLLLLPSLQHKPEVYDEVIDAEQVISLWPTRGHSVTVGHITASWRGRPLIYHARDSNRHLFVCIFT